MSGWRLVPVDATHEMLMAGYRMELNYADRAEMYDAMIAAAPSGWQPIETAPRDGTNVLLVNRKGNMATGLWMSGPIGTGWVLRGGSAPNVFFNEHHGPTHWMPLPAPPAHDQAGL